MEFTPTDSMFFHHPYFSLIRLTDINCELKSISTGHFWNIVLKSDYCNLEHKYSFDNFYHHQTSCATVEAALLEIVDHDEYFCKKRKISYQYPELFDYIVEIYKKQNIV